MAAKDAAESGCGCLVMIAIAVGVFGYCSKSKTDATRAGPSVSTPSLRPAPPAPSPAQPPAEPDYAQRLNAFAGQYIPGMQKALDGLDQQVQLRQGQLDAYTRDLQAAGHNPDDDREVQKRKYEITLFQIDRRNLSKLREEAFLAFERARTASGSSSERKRFDDQINAAEKESEAVTKSLADDRAKADRQ